MTYFMVSFRGHVITITDSEEQLLDTSRRLWARHGHRIRVACGALSLLPHKLGTASLES